MTTRTGDCLRVPPHDLQAERSVLGSMILNDKAIDEAEQLIRAEQFYADIHATVFSTIVRMRARNEPVDVVSLASALESAGTLTDIGGPSLLFQLMETVPHSAHVAHYCRIVRDRARRRLAMEAGRSLIALGDDLTTPTDEALASAESTLHAAIEGGVGAGPASMQDVLLRVLDSIDKPDDGLATGFDALDRVGGGMRPGAVIVIAARPSMGKTALALNIANNVAAAGSKVFVASYEMPSNELAQRLLVSRTGVPWSQLRTMRDTLLDAARKLAELPVTLDDVGPSATKLAATIRLAARKGARVVVVDYLQLVPPDDPRTPREQQVAQVSRQLKQVAVGCGITILALSQLNRQVETRGDGRPRLSDLRESGAIEQDADQVWMLWRPGRTSDHAPDDHGRIDIAKNRNGPTGLIDVAWHGPTSSFRSKLDESPHP